MSLRQIWHYRERRLRGGLYWIKALIKGYYIECRRNVLLQWSNSSILLGQRGYLIEAASFLHTKVFSWLIKVLLLQTPMRKFLNSLPADYYGYALIAMVVLSTVLVLMAKWASRRKATMTRKRKKLLLNQQEFVKSVVKAKKVCVWTFVKRNGLLTQCGNLK